LCLRLGSAFSIGDGARDEPELNDNSPELSLFSGSRESRVWGQVCVIFARIDGNTGFQ
jgi:hypothetical protein